MKQIYGFRSSLLLVLLCASACPRPAAAEEPRTESEQRLVPWFEPSGLPVAALPPQGWDGGDLIAGVNSLPRPTESPWWSLSANTVLRDPKAELGLPSTEEQWRTEESLSLPVYGPLSLFGQLGAGSKPTVAEELRVSGRAGIVCKVPNLLGADLQVRGGPQLSCTDPHVPEKMQEHSEWLFDVQCRVPLPGRLGLEYQGTAIPGLDLTDRDRFQQDLGVALPVGSAGKLRLGARHRWENVSTPKPWADGMQLYLGLELGR